MIKKSGREEMHKMDRKQRKKLKVKDRGESEKERNK